MHNSPHQPRICFVQLYALGLLDPGFKVPFGGAETRAVTFAKTLRDSGDFEVSFALFNETGRPLPSGPLQGMSVARMPMHDFTFTSHQDSMGAFYRSLKADCFVSLGANEASHEMCIQGLALGIPTVVGLASDQSLRDLVFNGSMIPNEYQAPSFHSWESMHQAGLVLTQTQWQQERLYRQVGKRGVLIRNPIPAGWEGPCEPRATTFAFDFLWVGRPLPDKNPEIVFELARELPQATFRMVVDGGLPEIMDTWRFRLPDNVILSDRLVNAAELKALMASSRAIINTSPLEGFPNLMLQGAMTGCPSLFLSVDPDEWSSQHGCAASAHGDFDEFVALLARARRDPGWIEDMAGLALRRATDFHAPRVVGPAFIEAIRQVIGNGTGGKA